MQFLRKKSVRISLIVLGVLAALFVAADRLAVYLAENEVANRGRDALGLSETPSVSINGFPFLTQVAGGSVDEVDLGVSSYQAQVDGQSVTVRDLSVRLNDTEFSDSYTRAVATTAEGEGIIDYAELSRAYGELLAAHDNGLTVEFGYAEGGRLGITLQASMLGQSLDLGEMAGDIVLVDDRVKLQVDEDEIPDGGGPEMERQIREQLDVERTVDGLPNGLRLRALEPTPDGLRLTATGSDVELVG
jgi:hypothetical protein